MTEHHRMSYPNRSSSFLRFAIQEVLIVAYWSKKSPQQKSALSRENMSGKTVYKMDFLNSDKYPPLGSPMTEIWLPHRKSGRRGDCPHGYHPAWLLPASGWVTANHGPALAAFPNSCGLCNSRPGVQGAGTLSLKKR